MSNTYPEISELVAHRPASEQVEEMYFEPTNDILMSLNRSEEDWALLANSLLYQSCYERAQEDIGMILRYRSQGWVGEDYKWLLRMGLIWLDRYLSRETIAKLMSHSAVATLTGAVDVVIFIVNNADTSALSDQFNLKATLLISVIKTVGRNLYPKSPTTGYDLFLRDLKLSPQLMAIAYSRLYNSAAPDLPPVIH